MKEKQTMGFFFSVLFSNSVNEQALELTRTTATSFYYRRFLRIIQITFSL